MQLSPQSFFHWKDRRTLIDIRPASAFGKGSLGGAVSMPLEYGSFTAEWMSELRHKAIGPIHLIDLDGSLAASISRKMEVFYLSGGYQSFRQWRDTVFSSHPPLILLGGKTGSGKTEVLQLLKKRGHQVLDLEALAIHKGSVFGNLANHAQPSHECFQNILLEQWLSFDPGRPVWVEEKSHILGSIGIPSTLYAKMSRSLMTELDIPFEERLQHIQHEYTCVDKKAFTQAIRQLEERMGTSANHKAIHYHASGQIEKCLHLLLHYYDRAYEKRRERFQSGAVIKVTLSTFQNEETLCGLEQEVMTLYKKRDPADFRGGLHCSVN